MAKAKESEPEKVIWNAAEGFNNMLVDQLREIRYTMLNGQYQFAFQNIQILKANLSRLIEKTFKIDAVQEMTDKETIIANNYRQLTVIMSKEKNTRQITEMNRLSGKISEDTLWLYEKLISYCVDLGIFLPQEETDTRNILFKRT